MFQAFHQLPQRAVQWSGHAQFLTRICDSAIHEVNFGLPFRHDILQHAGTMLAGSIRSLLHELPGIAV